MKAPHPPINAQRARWRGTFLLICFALGAAVLEGRILFLQAVDNEFLTAQANDRHLRTVQISAHRGSITDRNGEALAVSTPVDSIWANPQLLKPALDRLPELAAVLGQDDEWLARRLTSNLEREFVYLKRHLSPSDSEQVLALGLPGVGALREYRRYYPAAEVVGHVLGFTDVDDAGQEGLELAFDHWLKGDNGSKRIVQDRLGRVIEDVELVSPPRPGRELRTSIDLRLQYLAYRELKLAVTESRARSGSVVILDPATGEVLAMVNQPSYNPNARSQLDVARYRNRALTDMLEPGSSFKPMVLAAALETGRYTADTVVDTAPGVLRINGRIVTQDTNNLGRIDLTTVLAKSSNVGMANVVLGIDALDVWRVLSGMGIGRLSGSGFPGESAGVLNDPEHWRAVGQATISYGYGLSVTVAQLARAYSAIAAGGVLRPLSMLKVNEPPEGERVMSAATARALITMMEAVVASPEGTGQRAAVRNYRIAGKTGTAKKAGVGGYSEDRYIALFAGLAPASAPQIVVVVVIEEPQGEIYYGGDIAAPVFSNIVTGALRVLAVPPDALPQTPLTIVADSRVTR
jgi:cell division protein FtsI (penicillin-binding protein 3)